MDNEILWKGKKYKFMDLMKILTPEEKIKLLLMLRTISKSKEEKTGDKS
jgi:hypothetical protein